MNTKNYTFADLRTVIAKLRDPENGCPWDREQTHLTLKPYLLEEAYEVLDAIDSPPELCDELGDLLLQIMLHSQIASEAKEFDVEDVVQGLCEKLIRRHPHVFADEQLATASEVVNRWEELKKQEKKERTSALDGLPQSMSALSRSDKIGRRVSRIGFDWSTPEEVLEKVTEELDELKEALRTGSQTEIEAELGDFLFTTAQLSRLLKFHSEITLQQANQKFERRFRLLEDRAGSRLSDMSLEEMHVIWDQIKKEE